MRDRSRSGARACGRCPRATACRPDRDRGRSLSHAARAGEHAARAPRSAADEAKQLASDRGSRTLGARPKRERKPSCAATGAPSASSARRIVRPSRMRQKHRTDALGLAAFAQPLHVAGERRAETPRPQRSCEPAQHTIAWRCGRRCRPRSGRRARRARAEERSPGSSCRDRLASSSGSSGTSSARCRSGLVLDVRVARLSPAQDALRARRSTCSSTRCSLAWLRGAVPARDDQPIRSRCLRGRAPAARFSRVGDERDLSFVPSRAISARIGSCHAASTRSQRELGEQRGLRRSGAGSRAGNSAQICSSVVSPPGACLRARISTFTRSRRSLVRGRVVQRRVGEGFGHEEEHVGRPRRQRGRPRCRTRRG